MTTPTRPARGATDLDLVRAALDSEYEVVRELGRGGMAVVYEARERLLDRPVALKVLPFALAHDPDVVERFEREARTSAKLEHPNIIPVYRVGRSGQVTYFAMKLLRGLSLSDRLLAEGALGAEATRRILAETAAALGYAHQCGVVHRDVKPDNILFDADGRCVVTDFGIARSAADTNLTATGMSVGTPRYMSPEQARALAVDGRSDIYSLGVVGYECLAGRRPFDGSDMMAILLAHVSQPVPEPAGLGPAERAIYPIVDLMLRKSPDERFQRAEDVVAALAGANGLAPVATRPSGSRYAPIETVPASAPALDRALEIGVEMLRQQRPRIDAGLAAGRQALVKCVPVVRRVAAPAWARFRRAATAIAGYAVQHRMRFLSAVIGTALLLIGAPAAFHFAMYHRPACPPGDKGAFSVLIDDRATAGAGDDVDLYYDVCGLDGGTRFTVRVTLTLQQSGLRRLLGGTVAPVTARYEETASGPAIRRHRTLALAGMPPGAYTASVVVTDDKGRRRSRSTTVRVAAE